MKSIFLIAIFIGIVVVAYEGYKDSNQPKAETNQIQIVPVGSQPKDPTKPWCYEQQAAGHKVVVCH